MVSLGNQWKKGNTLGFFPTCQERDRSKILEYWNLIKQWPIYKSQFILGEFLGSTPPDTDQGWLEERQQGQGALNPPSIPAPRPKRNLPLKGFYKETLPFPT